LALTFGTLLSSQGADARRTRPWKVVVSGGSYYVTPCTARCHTRGSDLAAPGPLGPVSLGAKKKLRGLAGLVKPGGTGSPVFRCRRGGVGEKPQVTGRRGLRTCDPAHVTGGCPDASSVPDGTRQRPSRDSIPTVNPGRLPISRTASSTPGMKDARSKESWRIVSVSPSPPSSTSW
jgi:hypothetical protein